MKSPQNDRISKIMNDPEEIRKILKTAINDALLMHKQAGNPVCGIKEDKIVWINPKDIIIQDK